MEIPFGGYRRPFTYEGVDYETRVKSTSHRLRSALTAGGVELDTDETPTSGMAAVRNHALETVLADGRRLTVEAGYIGWWTVGIIVRVDGVVIHESHPGKTVAFPSSAAKMAAIRPDKEAQKANRIPIAIDIALGLLFFAVASLTDLTTAAIVGAVVGIGLVIAQRFISVDILGGLALFGTVMLVVSAIFALIFSDGIWVQLRTSIVGTITALLFGADALFNNGRWLGRGMGRYVPFEGIDFRRLAFGMAVIGLLLAALNVVVVLVASEQFWLIYTTFLDIPLVVVGVWIVIFLSFPKDRAADG